MQEKRVETIQNVDFSELRMPYIAVYQHPEDFPEKCVARIWDLDTPTNTIMVKDTVEEIAEDIRKHTGMTFVRRGDEDVLSLVGVWF